MNGISVMRALCAALVFWALTLSVPAQAQVVLNPANGHYYEAVPSPYLVWGYGIDWYESDYYARTMTFNGMRGKLASITSAAENQFIQDNLPATTAGQYWLGGVQSYGAASPADGWTWVTGEAFSYTNWAAGMPNDAGNAPNEWGYANGLRFTGASGQWEDATEWDYIGGGFVVEYEPLKPIKNPLNGHYYAVVQAPDYYGIYWSAANLEAQSIIVHGMQGYLATVTSAQETQFIVENFPTATNHFYWLGGYQDLSDPSYSEPGGGWKWVTGEPFEYTNWSAGEPNNNAWGYPEHFLVLWHPYGSGEWNDLPDWHAQPGYVIEFTPLAVTIDIKPGTYPNSVNLGSNGNVPVAIFSTATFDATSVNPTTVTLGGASVAVKGKGQPQASVQDVNGDGRPDLVVHIATQGLSLTDGDAEAALEGFTYAGAAIRGVDTVRIVP